MEYQPQKEVCVLKAPALKNFYCSQASGGMGLSPEDCRKRMYLALAWAPLFYARTACQTPFVYEGDCSSNCAESMPIREASIGSLQYKRLGFLL
jgi:hypothetical protein